MILKTATHDRRLKLKLLAKLKKVINKKQLKTTNWLGKVNENKCKYVYKQTLESETQNTATSHAVKVKK